MKHIIIILLTFLAFSLNAQEKQEKKVPIQKVKSASVEKEISEGEKFHIENKRVYVSTGNEKYEREKTVEYYDNYIKAVKTKVAFVKADENENAKAIETGWYDEMNLNIKKAKAEKFNLENKNR